MRIFDPAHGGEDPGAVFEGRQEKDDNLRLALAVGRILEDRGQDVVYTRTEDVYQTPLQKANIANQAGADYFVSLHRNSSPMPNQYNGVETLVYRDVGIPAEMAQNINSELEETGFRNAGVRERTGLVVLRRTRMPAVLVEAGFINNDEDNRIFDENFDAMAEGIANGILQSIQESGDMQAVNSPMEAEAKRYRQAVNTPMEAEARGYQQAGPDVMLVDGNATYQVQVGAFRKPENAQDLLNYLLMQGFPGYVVWEDELYKVKVGEFEMMENAVRLEQVLRRLGYNTFVTGG